MRHDEREYIKFLQRAVAADGINFCLNCLQEEAGELVTKISHLRRDRCDIDDVFEEMAHVQLMIDMCSFAVPEGKSRFSFSNSMRAKVGYITTALEKREYKGP